MSSLYSYGPGGYLSSQTDSQALGITQTSELAGHQLFSDDGAEPTNLAPALPMCTSDIPKRLASPALEFLLNVTQPLDIKEEANMVAGRPYNYEDDQEGQFIETHSDNLLKSQ